MGAVYASKLQLLLGSSVMFRADATTDDFNHESPLNAFHFEMTRLQFRCK